MKNLTNFLFEKLKLNKNTKIIQQTFSIEEIVTHIEESYVLTEPKSNKEDYFKLIIYTQSRKQPQINLYFKIEDLCNYCTDKETILKVMNKVREWHDETSELCELLYYLTDPVYPQWEVFACASPDKYNEYFNPQKIVTKKIKSHFI